MRVNSLYLPEKYKVVLGNGIHIGLCTVWSDPDIVIKQIPELLNVCAIIGTLYSKEGVNIMLRNLCLNPQITHVLIWGRGQLSQTPIGKSGWSILDNLWRNGISNDGIVNGSDFKLHANMDFSIINKVVKNVQLIDVSNLDLQRVLESAKKLEKKPTYMEPASFPVYQREATGKLPSEEVGWVVRGRKIANAWVKEIDRILRYGTIKPTEYGNQMKELAVVTIVVEEEDTKNPHIPDWPKDLKKLVGLKKDDLEKYISSIFFSTELPEGTTYTYGQRLRAYPTEAGKVVDQVQAMIDRLKKKSNVTRRAVATLWYPPIDKDQNYPPCITQVQVLQNEGKLHMFATDRSQDVFKAGIFNAFGLRALQEYMAKELGLKVGELSVTANSAHIYEEDWENAKKLVQCEIWERPVSIALGAAEEDPRAVVLVRVEGKKLVAEVMTKEGELISRIEGDTANEACIKLANLDLLFSPRHYTDIARQLQKAEIARDLEIEFEQDKPLKIYSLKHKRDVITGFY